jgi:hypothetical protein
VVSLERPATPGRTHVREVAQAAEKHPSTVAISAAVGCPLAITTVGSPKIEFLSAGVKWHEDYLSRRSRGESFR